MKTVLMGQAPSKKSDPLAPLASGSSARVLAALCGLTREDYLDAFERLNVFDAWPGSTRFAKGDLFPIKAAKIRAATLLPTLFGKSIVFLGKKTAGAFGFKMEYLDWHSFANGRAAILPHPSGINLWYNSAFNIGRAQEFLRAELNRSRRFA